MRRLFLACLLILPSLCSAAVPEVHINVTEQSLSVIKEGQRIAKYKISTSMFGLGDEKRSYKTPLGAFEVNGKKGDKLPLGAVLKGGRPTGEVLLPNAPGRDPIVTRIISLKGLEEQNRNAHERGIWIHGTPQERQIGTPASWGCIRMRSEDVVKLFNIVKVGTRVTIEGSTPTPRSSNPFTWLTRALSQTPSAAPAAPVVISEQLASRLQKSGTQAEAKPLPNIPSRLSAPTLNPQYHPSMSKTPGLSYGSGNNGQRTEWTAPRLIFPPAQKEMD